MVLFTIAQNLLISNTSNSMTDSSTAAIPLIAAVGLAETMKFDQLPDPEVHR